MLQKYYSTFLQKHLDWHSNNKLRLENTHETDRCRYGNFDDFRYCLRS
jgi:hypothetical protein